LQLTIEKLIYGGDGLARLPAATSTNSTANDPPANDARARGKAVFIPFVLAGEKIEAALTGQKSGFARGKAEAVLEASPHRVQPGCPHFTKCGGCHYQHASYEYQLEIKQQILRENLLRMAKLELSCAIEVHASPPWNYRNRSRLQVQTQPHFAAGYFKFASHHLLPVEECPISSPLINRGILSLWQAGRAGKVASGVNEIEFFANADDSQLLVTLWCVAGARRVEVKSFAEEWKAMLPQIAGVVAFREQQPGARKPGAPEVLVSVGDKHLTYQTEHGAYRVSAGAFFQTNRHLTAELVKIVTQGRSGELALDLYAGVGLFSTALGCDFRHIVCVEPSHLSFSDLAYNLPKHGDAIQATTEEYLTRLESPGRDRPGAQVPTMDTQRLPRPDLIVLDPPRSGLGERVVGAVLGLGAPRVTYVSCDPATLARDLVPFLAAGYRVEQAHLVDLFPQTYHLETVLQLVR
jgi:23S rRNA (uracil1939-C5)-methyltransferase